MCVCGCKGTKIATVALSTAIAGVAPCVATVLFCLWDQEDSKKGQAAPAGEPGYNPHDDCMSLSLTLHDVCLNNHRQV